MTKEEDAANEVIRACDHELVKQGKRIVCAKCGVVFCVLMLPRLTKGFAIPDDDD